MICASFFYGANRDRTGDLLLAKQALSQLSYGPSGVEFRGRPPHRNAAFGRTAERRATRTEQLS
jgi:hypothetical protein